jgi:flagellar biosynthesis protein FlhG
MATTIAVTSGKGGVGKTSIAVNLAITLKNLGNRVYLFDADYGMANAHILMGVNPEYVISDLISNKVTTDQLACDGPNGLKLISGGAGFIDMLNLEQDVRLQTIRAMQSIEEKTDYLIVDVAAGASDGTTAFIAAADRVLVVLVGEPTSFLDAYALIKATHLEKGIIHFNVLVNMAGSDDEAQSYFDKFRKTVTQFLDVSLHFAGSFPMSSKLRKSIISRKPVCLDERNAREVLALQRVANNIIRSPMNATDGIRFFERSPQGEMVR